MERHSSEHLTLYRAERQPGDQPALNQRGENERRQRDQRRRRHQRAPLRRAFADEVEGRRDQRLAVAVRQHQREQEIVPGEDEGQDRRNRDARTDQRERDPPASGWPATKSGSMTRRRPQEFRTAARGWSSRW